VGTPPPHLCRERKKGISHRTVYGREPRGNTQTSIVKNSQHGENPKQKGKEEKKERSRLEGRKREAKLLRLPRSTGEGKNKRISESGGAVKTQDRIWGVKKWKNVV